MLLLCRKYYGESRYPFGGDKTIYNKQFCEEFLKYLENVKEFVDNQCQATSDEVVEKYDKRHKD
jgi:HEPN domain-containing protein